MNVCQKCVIHARSAIDFGVTEVASNATDDVDIRGPAMGTFVERISTLFAAIIAKHLIEVDALIKPFSNHESARRERLQCFLDYPLEHIESDPQQES